MATAPEAGAARNPPWVDAFFDRLYEPILHLANSYHIDPKLLLAHAAHESGWFRTDAAKGNFSAKKNAVFGFSNGQKPIPYPSPEDSIRRFGEVWGNRLQEIEDPDVYVQTLRNQKYAYNSEDPKYDHKIRNMVKTIEYRLPIWKLEQNRKALLPKDQPVQEQHDG
jgi:flagellum-specific peptidoglycan hydrolase FlgJ